jgi:hypothetical protein
MLGCLRITVAQPRSPTLNASNKCEVSQFQLIARVLCNVTRRWNVPRFLDFAWSGNMIMYKVVVGQFLKVSQAPDGWKQIFSPRCV